MTLGFNEIKLEETSAGPVVTLVIVGKLDKGDYEMFTPQLEQYIEKKGKIRLVVEMRDLKSFSPGAVWEDIKFAAKHFNDIEKMALIGDKKWERAMASFAKPFTMAQVKYFDESEKDQAMEWIRGER